MMGGKNVEQRVIEMRFDNQQFEQNVKTTMGTLDRLKNALSSIGSNSKGFGGLAAATSKFDLSPLMNAADTVSSRFSAMGVVGMTVLQNLTSAAMNLASNMVNRLTGPIFSGGYARAQKIENAQFTLQGLLKDAGEVEAVMKNVGDAVDGTAYGLDAAASVAAQFAASGQKAGPVLEANLKAVAGVAAMTNSSYEEIGRIFTTVSGQGRLMGDQLNQLAVRGLDATQIIGDYLGKTGAEVRELTSKGKIDFQTFADAMYDAFGEQAKKADETFTGVMANIRAALARTGAGFYAPLIKQNSNLIKMLQTVKSIISTTFNKSDFWTGLQEDFTSFALEKFEEIDKWLQSVDFGTIIKGFDNLYTGAKLLIEPIKFIGESFYYAFEMMGYLQPTAKGFENFTKKILDGIRKIAIVVTQMDLYTYITGPLTTIIAIIESVISIVSKLAKGLIPELKPVLNFAKVIFLFITSIARGISAVLGKLNDDIGGFGNVFAGLGDFLEKVLAKPTEIIQKLGDEISEKLFSIRINPDIFAGVRIFAKNVSDLGKVIKEYADNFNLFEKIKNTVSTVISFITEKFDAGIEKIKEFFRSFNDKESEDINAFQSKVDTIKRVFETVFGAIAKAGEKVKKIFGVIGRAIWEFFGSITLEDIEHIGIIGIITMLSGSFKNLLDTIRGLTSTVNGIASGGLLSAVLGNWGPTLKNLSSSFKEMQKSLKAESLLKIAAAIAIMAGSLIALSMIQAENLMNALVALSGVALVLGGFTKAMSSTMQVLSDLKRFPRINSQMLVTAVSLFVVALAVKKLADLPMDAMARGLIGMTAIVFALYKITSLMATLQRAGDKWKAGPVVAMMLGMSISLGLIASAIKKMGSLKPEDLAKGIIGMVMGMLALVGTVMLIADLAPRIKNGAFMLIAIGIAIGMIGDAISKITQSGKPAEFMMATVGIMMIVGGVVALSASLEHVKAGTIFATFLMIFALVKLINSVAKLADMDIKSVWKAAGAVMALMAAMAAIVLAMAFLTSDHFSWEFDTKKMLALGASFIILAAAVRILVPAIQALGDMSIGQMAVALITMAGAFVIFGAALRFIQGNAGAVFSILGLTVALGLLTPILITLGSLGKVAAIGLGVIAGGLVILGLAAFAFAKLNLAVPLFMLAGALIAISAAVAIFAAGVFLFSVALASFAASSAGVAAGIALIFTTLVDLIPYAAVKVVEGIVAFAEAIGSAAPRLYMAAVTCLLMLILAVDFVLPLVAQAVVKLLITIVNTLVTYVPVIVQALFDLIIGLMNGLANAVRNNSDRIFAAIKNIISAIIELFITAIEELLNLTPFGGLAEGPLEKFKDGVRNTLVDEDLTQSGESIPEKLVEGMNKGSGALTGASEGLVSKVTEPFTNMLNSGEISNYGSDFIGQFTQGMTNGETDLSAFGGDMVTQMMSGATESGEASAAGTQINDEFMSAFRNDDAGGPQASGETFSTDMLNGMKIPQEDGRVEEAGRSYSDSYITGVLSAEEDGSAANAGERISQATLNETDIVAEMKQSGKDAANGFVDGLSDKKIAARAERASAALGKIALRGTRRALDEHSPSKEMEKIGRFGGLGLANGFMKSAPLVEHSGETLGDTALNTIHDAVSRLDGYRYDGFDLNPSITPVLDMSSVQNGANAINSMLNMNRTYQLAGTYGMDVQANADQQMVDMMNSNTDILISIRDLLASQDIRLDSGELVGGIVAKMDSALGTRMIRRGRGVG